MSAESFGEGSALRLLTNVNCQGNETTLLDCERTVYTGSSCVTSGVACQGMCRGQLGR